MKRIMKSIKGFFLIFIERGKEVEQRKAGKKWDSIVEELKNRS